MSNNVKSCNINNYRASLQYKLIVECIFNEKICYYWKNMKVAD